MPGKAKPKSLGENLIEAMQDAVAHRKGKLALRTRLANVPQKVDVAAIRRSKGLTQRAFAERYGFDVRALQEWEQGRREPERSTRILLRVIEREPEAVERALRTA